MSQPPDIQTPDVSHSEGNALSGPVAWFAKNKVAANLLMVFFLLVGILLAKEMNAEMLPQIDPRTVVISTVYPGASPEDIELSITRRIEEAVIGTAGIKRVRSTASDSSGLVTVELLPSAKSQLVKDDIETAIDQLSDFPPAGADEPSIVVPDPVSSVVTVAISGQVGEGKLRSTAEVIERDLMARNGISSVTIQGARKYEISIEVKQDTLREYDLSINEISAAIKRASVNLSGGSLRTAAGNILLRVDQEARVGQDFNAIIIKADQTGQIIRLSDVAQIIDGFEDVQFESLFNNLPAVFVQVNKTSAEDSFQVSREVSRYLSTFEPEAGIKIETTEDNTKYTRGRILLLVRNGVMGLALVFVFLSLTLDMRLAFWTSAGIPIAFLGAFLFISQLTTINQLSLFALVMVLGLVVDDAIVVGENIYEEQQSGKVGAEAAVAGTLGVIGPVTVGVVTTMAAFSPVLFGVGILGQIVRPIAIVVISVLAISLIEVFFILPNHLSHGGNWSMGPMRRLKWRIQNRLFGFRDRVIMPITRRAVKYRYVALSTGVAIFMVVSSLFQTGQIRFVFFTQTEGETVVAKLLMPEGTPYEHTKRITEHLTRTAYETVGGQETGDYLSMKTTIGGQLGSGFELDEGTVMGSNIGYVSIELLDPDNRPQTAAQVEREWRKRIGRVAGAESLEVASTGFAIGEDISYDLSHEDEVILQQAVNRFKSKIITIDGVSNVKTAADGGTRQFEFILNDAGAAAGLSVSDIAMQVRQSFFGNEVQRIQRGGDEIRVYVRLAREERRSMDDVKRLRIRTPSGAYVPLQTVADFVEKRGDATINRVDGRRIISVTGDVDEAIMVPNEATALISERFLPDIKKEFPRLQISAEGQSTDQREEFEALSKNFSFALLFMYLLLASVLRSYTQPLTILAAIPFGFVGAVFGHMLMGYDFSFLSIIGVVALSGVVINDSVVLIDQYNKNWRAGIEKKEAVYLAVERRFRPIFLTTVTTFIGLLPILTETSLQAQYMIPTAISLAFGIIAASLVTLILVPALLLIFQDIEGLKKKIVDLLKQQLPAE